MNFLDIAMILFLLASAAWLSMVALAIRIDQRSSDSQTVYINGKSAIINREGCAEASNLCALLGGYDCKEFKRFTGESVEDFCCRTYREGCYKQKPLPDGREGVGDR